MSTPLFAPIVPPAPEPSAEDLALDALRKLSDSVRRILEERRDARDAAKRARIERAQARLLTPREAAAMLADSQRTVTEWCRRGIVRSENHGKGAVARYRIPLSEVERMRSTHRRRGLQAVV